jgi:UDP-N-acetylglucosamine 2-epimerase (non-hydrolysing)
MKYKKIMMVFGTRPEAIKMAPVYKMLKDASHDVTVNLCVTGQHRHMLDQVLKIFEIEPDYDLNIMKDHQDLYDITSNVLIGLKPILKIENPDLVLVHGDTTTAMASAMAAFYSSTPVGHIEAGLRTNDILSPFPEEFNRQIVSKIASLHFSPTQNSSDNLIREGVDPAKIHITGNTVIDALHLTLNNIKNSSVIEGKILKRFGEILGEDWLNKRMVLITGHRRENFGLGFIGICEAINRLATIFPDVNFVYPVHLNPNVQTPVIEYLGGMHNVKLIPPLGYEEFAYLMEKSYLILTDSGGIQEEAPSLGKPVVVLRGTTERPEAVDAGTVILVGTDSVKIIKSVSELLTSDKLYAKMSKAHNPYGNGNACKKIKEVLFPVEKFELVNS